MTTPINSAAPRPFVAPAEIARVSQERANAQPQARNGLERDEGTAKPSAQSAQELRQRNREAREARLREQREEAQERRTNARSREVPGADGSAPQRRAQPGQVVNIVV